jgi:8-oxo-dGTP pyrophosphatase MutT (NUDIX family)
MGRRQRRSAGAIILSNNGTQCLLVKQKEGQRWSLPKGSCLELESLEMCMKREVFEETGLELDRCRHFVKGKQRWKRYMVYIVRLLDPVESITLCIRDNAEIDGVQWISIDRVHVLPLNKVTRDSIYRYRITTMSSSQFQHFGNRRRSHWNF